MKINEKNLTAFATSSTPVDREGWLLKRGEVNKSFQKRWFVLKGNLLFYFDRKCDKEPVGLIILEGCTIELAEEEEQFCFKLVFHGVLNRVYVLGAESQECMESWMKALACASYDYVKLMVAELQRQLEEISDGEQACALPPEVPSRSRTNPFLTNSHNAVATTPSSMTLPSTVTKPKRTFIDIHREFGARIVADREARRVARDSKIVLKEDILVSL